MKLVIGNQKTYLEANKVENFIEKFKEINNKNVILCPSSIYLNMFANSNVLLGSQDVSKYDGDATTGEISAKQLRSIKVYFSIVGHSERRQLLNETIEDTNIKIKRLLDNNMIPILCIGETKEEKDKGQAKDVILSEIVGAFKDISNELIEKVIIAYEPIWSIGTGIVPTNEEITEIAKYIRDILKKDYKSANLLLYGGSVNLKNIDELNNIDIIDGYLIGGASTKVDEFIEIIDKCK